MHIQSLHSTYGSPCAAAPAPAAAGAGAIAVDQRGDGDGDDDRAGRGEGHHRHGGGRMQHALQQALQSLGLPLPGRDAPATPAAAAGSDVAAPADSSPASTTPPSDGDADPRQTLRADVHEFMHQRFQALRDSADGSAGSPDGDDHPSRHDRREKFAGAISSLVGQVAGGNAPEGLQSAFDKLVTDLEAFGAATAQAGGTGSATPSPTLQELLTALGQQTGYGATAGSGALGNTVDTVA